MLAMAGPERHKVVCISIVSIEANRSNLADDYIDDCYLLVQAWKELLIVDQSLVINQASRRGQKRQRKEGCSFVVSFALCVWWCGHRQSSSKVRLAFCIGTRAKFSDLWFD
jgi:hypothetical protein